MNSEYQSKQQQVTQLTLHELESGSSMRFTLYRVPAKAIFSDMGFHPDLSMVRSTPTGNARKIGPLALLLALGLAACQANQAPFSRGAASDPAANAPVGPGYDAASYLTANQATALGDIETASRDYTYALAADPDNERLLARSFRSLYLSGRIDSADAIATKLGRAGVSVKQGSEPAAAIAGRNGDWRGLEVVATHLSEDAGSYTLGKVLEAWSLAFQGRGDAGLSALADAGLEEGAAAMLSGQFALMQEHLGRGGEALSAARAALDRDARNFDTVVLMAGVLARHGAIVEAENLLLEQSGGNFAWKRLAASLDGADSPLMRKPPPRRLLANAIVDVVTTPGNPYVETLARLRLARFLDGDDGRVNYHLGRGMERTDTTLEVFAAIPEDSPWHEPSRIAVALELSRTPDGMERAARILDGLIADDPENPMLWRLAGDNSRRHKRFDAALDAFDRALALGGDRARLEYSRAVALDHLGRDSEAEAAFRESLEIDRGNPFMLNYFGYWLLENGGDAREALSLIRLAVEAQPRNGYFVDSLGWGYFRLGQYRKALNLLERAVTLEPTNATIIDHLGDAYAKNGRRREAVFEWQRALHYADDEVDPEEIQAKIDGVKSGTDQ